MKIAMVTALFGNHDFLNEQPQNEFIDWFCFTDQDIESTSYAIVKSDDVLHDPRRTSRLFKIMPHLFFPGYDVVIWHDANIVFVELEWIIQSAILVLNEGLMIPRHYKRNCIYDEAIWVKVNKKEDEDLVDKQVKEMILDNYPEQNGLVNAGIIIRDNRNKEVIKFNVHWWKMFQEYSCRDQLSFNYVAWKLQFQFKAMPINIYNHSAFSILPHRGESFLLR